VRLLAQQKGIEMRSQGWSGAAMLPYGELEYSGFRQSIGDLVNQFAFRNGHGLEIPAPQKAGAGDGG
jgi:fructose 1,6-bisphosphate aldolase/phosphatase